MQPPPLAYGVHDRRTSRSATASFVIGVFVVTHMLSVAHWGLPANASLTVRWLMVGPSYALAPIGIGFGFFALIKRRRWWWLAVPGVLLNGLHFLVIGVLLFQYLRYLRAAG